jgi:hypothetical protein
MIRRYFRDVNRNPQGILLSEAQSNGWKFGASFRNPVDPFDKYEGDVMAFDRFSTAKPIKYGLPRQKFLEVLEKTGVPEKWVIDMYQSYVFAHYLKEMPPRNSALPNYYNTILSTPVVKKKKRKATAS